MISIIERTRSIALDGYIDLWNRAYANIRFQTSPQRRLFPDYSHLIEIYQGAGRGWELAASWSQFIFGENNVDLYGAAIGKYRGNWYY
ncbi:MAG: YaiO family outer membrane beta-barrel protein [Candidatus Lindowbacteria bacterium]|nr:YaiO family outer membrane beta-barrel protein [Candidatus Lindowbacteria bacterium]